MKSICTILANAMKVNFLFFLVTKNFESIVPNQEWKLVNLSVFIYLGQDYKYLTRSFW